MPIVTNPSGPCLGFIGTQGGLLYTGRSHARGAKDAEDIDHFTNSINDSEFAFEISEVHNFPQSGLGCFKLLPIVLLVDTESKE